jgi:two-component system phosphate regulon sensor histidine kinase PhoR
MVHLFGGSMKKQSLFFKLFPSYFIITLFSLLAVSYLFARFSKSFFINQKETDLKVSAQFLIPDILRAMNNNSLLELEQKLIEISHNTETRITLISSSGDILLETNKDKKLMANHSNRPEVRKAIAGFTGVSIRYSSTLSKNMLYVALPVYLNGEVEGVLRLSKSISSIESVLKRIYLNIFLAVIIILGIAVVFCFFAVKRITKPIIELKDVATTISGGYLEARVEPPQISEFAELAGTINSMAEELTKKIKEISIKNYEKRAILSSMVEGVIAVDSSFRVMTINDAALKYFEVSGKKQEGKLFHEIIRNTDLLNILKETNEEEVSLTKEIFLPYQNNLFLKVTSSLIKDSKGRNLGVLLVINDITRIKSLEQYRKDFIANLSHEIKTPITIILGAIETLNSGALESKELTEKFLKTITKHSNRLNDLVENILNLSRIEQLANSDNIKKEECELQSIFTLVNDLFLDEAERKRITLEFSKVNISLNINRKLIEQAIINLVSNAIKYSPEDSELKVTAKIKNDNCYITVEDNGQGIPANHLDRLFERFYRVDKGRSREVGGTGLGLAIVKHIIKLHNGEVLVDSRVGVGSKFTIILPV